MEERTAQRAPQTPCILIWIHETHPPLRVHRYEPVNADQTEQVAAANRGRERKGPHADGALQMHAEG